jgi:hypothetical protein
LHGVVLSIRLAPECGAACRQEADEISDLLERWLASRTARGAGEDPAHDPALIQVRLAQLKAAIEHDFRLRE